MKYKTFTEWIMILFPILNIYLTSIPSVSIGELLLLILGLSMAIHRKNINFDMKLIWFYSYTFLITCICSSYNIHAINVDGLNNLLSYLMYAFFLLIYFNLGDVNSFCCKFLLISRITSVVSLLQFVLIQFGIRIPIIIPLLPNSINKSYAEISASLYSMCGPFTEPAHLAQFLSIGLIIALLNKKKRISDILLITITMSFTMKGNAVVALGVIYGLLFYVKLTRGTAKNILNLIVISGGIAFFLIILYNSMTVVQALLSRVNEISGDGNLAYTGYYGVSGYFRVKYGFDFYNSLDIFSKIFGIGVCSFNLFDGLSVVPMQILGLKATLALEHYRSGITAILIDTGCIGLFLYLNALLKDKVWQRRFFALSLISLQCVSGILNSPIWVIYVFLSFRYKIDNRELV